MTWRFHESVRSAVVDGALVVDDGHRAMVLDDPLVVSVAGLVAGLPPDSVTVARIADELGPGVGRPEVVRALRRLRAHRLITQAPAPSGPNDRLIDALGLSADRPRLRVVAVGPEATNTAEALEVALEEWGCSITDETLFTIGDEQPATVVAVATDLLDPRLDALNQAALLDVLPWVIVRAVGRELLVGPRFAPGRTGCWSCFAERYSGNHALELRLRAFLDAANAPAPPMPVVPGAVAHVARIIATDALQAELGSPSPLLGTMSSIDVVTGVQQHHPLVRLEHCSACGDRGDDVSPAAVGTRINAGPRASAPGARLLRPADLLAHLDPHVDRHLGAFTSVSDHRHGGSTTRHTAVVTHAFPSIGTSLADVRHNLAGRSAGQGDSMAAARAVALAEAAERRAGCWRPGIPQVRTTLSAAPGPVLRPDDVLLFSEDQYARRSTWNVDPTHVLHRVPERLADDEPVDLTGAWSLSQYREVLVPSGLVWFGHPDLRAHPYAATDSNGCAAGGSLAEAALHGLTELVERDAVACWWYSRARRPGVDLDALADPVIQGLREVYESLGRELWVLDLTHDVGLPIYAAVSRCVRAGEDDPEAVLVGFGADRSAPAAVRRAILEQDQLLPMLVGPGPQDPATREWMSTVRCAEEPWLLPTGELRRVRAPATGRGHDADELRHLVESLDVLGVEVLVVDQTEADVGLDVCRVLAPGLRHFWRRSAPGRLYDVPVAQGWIGAELLEEDLNPWNVFV